MLYLSPNCLLAKSYLNFLQTICKYFSDVSTNINESFWSNHTILFSAYQQKTSCEKFIVHKSVIDIGTLQERAVDMEDYATVRRIKLEQCVQLATFKTDANQVSNLDS